MRNVIFIVMGAMLLASQAFAGNLLEQYEKEQREETFSQYKGSPKTDYHSNKPAEKPMSQGVGTPGSQTPKGGTPMDLNDNGSKYGRRSSY